MDKSLAGSNYNFGDYKMNAPTSNYTLNPGMGIGMGMGGNYSQGMTNPNIDMKKGLAGMPALGAKPQTFGGMSAQTPKMDEDSFLASMGGWNGISEGAGLTFDAFNLWQNQQAIKEAEKSNAFRQEMQTKQFDIASANNKINVANQQSMARQLV